MGPTDARSSRACVLRVEEPLPPSDNHARSKVGPIVPDSPESLIAVQTEGMKVAIGLSALVLSFGIAVSSASAHDPIILTRDQSEPTRGPLIPDGTISFALYGTVDGAGDTRSFRVVFAEGDRFYLSLLIPDLVPENALDDEQLPYIELVDPAGAVTVLRPDLRVPFAEPFSGTNYIRLRDLDTTAVAGEYSVTVIGAAPARFTVSVGFKELFGTPVEGVVGRSLGVTGVMDWYATPPLEDATTDIVTTVASVQSSQAPPAEEDQVVTDPTPDTESSVNWVLVVAIGGGVFLVIVAIRVGVVRHSRNRH